MNNNLRVLRAKQRLTQLELARRARIGTTRLWKLENGYAQPTADERARIAAALGMEDRGIWVGRRRQLRGAAAANPLAVSGAA